LLVGGAEKEGEEEEVEKGGAEVEEERPSLSLSA
jgi:hypothetical protein